MSRFVIARPEIVGTMCALCDEAIKADDVITDEVVCDLEGEVDYVELMHERCHSRREKVTPKYTRGDLEDAFALVADPDDWKAPISKTVELDPGDVERVKEAVVFFTATEAEVKRLDGEPSGMRETYWVSADGYRAGPAGP